MTTTLIVIISFAVGFMVCSILSWKIHRRHKKSWHQEYRRLMSGIADVIFVLKDGNVLQKTRISTAIITLKNIYNGDL